MARISKYSLLAGGSQQNNSFWLVMMLIIQVYVQNSNMFLCSAMQRKNTVKWNQDLKDMQILGSLLHIFIAWMHTRFHSVHALTLWECKTKFRILYNNYLWPWYIHKICSVKIIDIYLTISNIDFLLLHPVQPTFT